MDAWLTDEVKELFFQPLTSVTYGIGQRLDNRMRMRQSIDERVLTEYLVDTLDTNSDLCVLNPILPLLKELEIYLATSIKKSTKEYENGTDIGLIINRNCYYPRMRSNIKYACLVQCKKVDNNGEVLDFYHKVKSSQKHQSTLMLDISPSSFYFVFVPPSLVSTFGTTTSVGFLSSSEGCSSPIWTSTQFKYEQNSAPVFSLQNKASLTGVLVVPAIAVEAQDRNGTRKAYLKEILPNCVPLWYWFVELFLTGFVGDRSEKTLSVAQNEAKFSVQLQIANGG